LFLANKIHMTNDTKELLDKTGRFLIEKRGQMHIKVTTNCLNVILISFLIWFSKGKGEMTTYWLLEELETKIDLIDKNFLYVQPSKFKDNNKTLFFLYFLY